MGERSESIGPAFVPSSEEIMRPPDQVHRASIKKAGRGDRDREEQKISTLAAGTGQKSLRQGGCLSSLSVTWEAIFSPLPVEISLNRSVDPGYRLTATYLVSRYSSMPS
jgi:hypothetical protein